MKLLFLLVFITGSILSNTVAQAQTGQPTQNEWNKIVEAAKKEGKVVVSVPASAELRKDREWAKKLPASDDANARTSLPESRM